MKANGSIYVVGKDGRSALVKDGDDIPSWAVGVSGDESGTPAPPINESVPADALTTSGGGGSEDQDSSAGSSRSAGRRGGK